VVSEKSGAHVDVRVAPETRDRFKTLYHKWAPGKDDPSMEAFLLYLIEGGERGLTTMRYRPGSLSP
jgi:hypothetical protein